jgi:hypothetical protein
MNFGGTATAITSARFDAFAMFDSIISFQDGTAYRKF